jgi:hypothetical protein
VHVDTVSTLTADADAFHLTVELDAFEADRRVLATRRAVRIPRDHV